MLVRKTRITLALIWLIFVAPTVLADVTLPRLISDGVILQRDTNNLIWGWAKDGERVSIKLNGKLVATAITNNNQWAIKLDSQPVGGPHVITVAGNNTVSVNDVYFGDVWLASGQSNMELPMDRVQVKYPQEFVQTEFANIRQFKVPKKYDFKQPNSDLDNGQWQTLDANTIGEFSAVGYFFAKQLNQKYRVPIGIINNSYGGSPVEAWISEEALKQYPHYLEVINQYRQGDYLKNLIASDQQRNDDWYANLNSQDAGLNEQAEAQNKHWYDNDYNASAWAKIQLPNFWQDAGVTIKNGVVWFKKSFELTADEANLPAKLELGRIVDADTTYVNGVEVGHITYQYPPRRYNVPANVLKAGKNTITVRVISSAGKGGFVKGKPYFIQIGPKTLLLEGTWQYQVGAESPELAGPKFLNYNQPLGFYNAMLAPLLKSSIKGVIWYQGESNTGRPQEYMSLFPALIRDWRKQFQQGNFPFIYVQLANFMEARAEPVESTWAETREAQRLALLEPNTAMAVAIDVGEWNDIHPLNKKTVGDRLAIAAQNLAYADKTVVYSGPQLSSMKILGDTAVLSFTHRGSGLSINGEKLLGFAIAGHDGKFVWAKAQISDDQVMVSSKQVTTPTQVRYAWADNPANANFINKEGLPASPFQVSQR